MTQRAALTPFLHLQVFCLWNCKRRELCGLCFEWEGAFLRWRFFFPLGSSSISQSLTIPIPSVRKISPKGFFIFRAVFYAITGNLVSNETVESNSLPPVGSSMVFFGHLLLYISASFYTCCLYLRCRGSS